ncbi:MAG: protoporphyrinogen oxidase HemJ, partial [Pseudomonadota bacterium]
MSGWLAAGYPWFKALHVITVIAWMAGLFYLPRLFVYHAEKAAVGGELSETFKVMERRLLKAIMNPAGVAAWVFGLLTIASLGWEYLLYSPWLHAKLVLVAAMTWFHHRCVTWQKAFAADENVHGGRYFRMWNEAPTVLMVGIV